MTKNPFVNAFGASIYILLVAFGMNLISTNLRNKPDTFFAPIVFLSVLTLSASFMAYTFFYQPVRMLIEGKKADAVSLFTNTLGIFGVITVIELILLLLGVF